MRHSNSLRNGSTFGANRNGLSACPSQPRCEKASVAIPVPKETCAPWRRH